jgi:hypothetical protein
LKGFETMTVTFQSGMYFDPMYGWRTDKPVLQKQEEALPVKEIDDSMAYVIDDQLQKVIDRLRVTMDAQREIRNAQHQEMVTGSNTSKASEDISYFMDQQAYGDVKSYIAFDGNKMSVTVNLRHSYYITNSLSNYEEHRKSIENLGKYGFCDEAISMFLDELDKEFVSYICKGLSDQLQGLGYSVSDANRLGRTFNAEYLKVRGSTGSIEGDAQKVLNKLLQNGFPKVDVLYGKPGHYGILPPGYNDPRTPPEIVEGYFKMMEAGEAWQEAQERSLPEPLYVGMKGNIQYNGKDIHV